MVWVFTKEGRQLRCEVARTSAQPSYRLTVSLEDRTTVEDIADPAALVDRLAAVMLDIHAEGWQLP